MKRRSFIKKSFLTTGGLLLGSSFVYRLMDGDKKLETLRQVNIKKVSEGKGKNVLVLMSAGTKNGNTDRLTDAYIKGLVERGHTVTKVYLGSMRLDGCRGCGACQRNGNRCAINDDMQSLYPLFKQCDVVVMASPLYFWTVTARLKAFIERLYAISVNDEYPTKGTVLLMTAGDDKPDTFNHPLQYFHIISGVLGNHELGHYCAGGCTGCENVARNIKAEHLDNAYRLGLSLS